MGTVRRTLAPVSVGCDIGKVNDPTSVCVVEHEQRPTGRFREGARERASLDEVWNPATAVPIYNTHFMVRHIARVPLNTSYPNVARHFASLLASPLFAGRIVTCRIDITGCGSAVFDMVVEEVDRRFGADAASVELVPIIFTAGQKYNRTTGSLGKEYFVSRMQALLQGGRVHGADTPEMHALMEELRIYEIRVGQSGAFTAGAFQSGRHDDMVTSMGLACLCDEDDEGIESLDAEIVQSLSNYRGW